MAHDLGLGTIIDSCRLFSAMAPEGRRRLCAMAQRIELRSGEVVFRDGDPPPGAYVVGRGLVRVFKLAPSGKDHVLHLVGPGATFCEAAAIGAFPCPAHAEALEPTLCALLPTALLREALAQDHALCLDLLGGLTGWVKYLAGLLEDVALRDAAGRVARYLLHASAGGSGEVTLPSSKRHLASHLNLTSETLSRTLRRLTDAGLVQGREGGRIALLDRQGLERVAGSVLE